MFDLVFPVQGEALPTDHAYALFAALSRLVPAFHDAEAKTRFAPIGGPKFDRGRLRITPRSTLRVRLPQARIGEVIALAGKKLEIDGHGIRLGVPFVRTVITAHRQGKITLSDVADYLDVNVKYLRAIEERVARANYEPEGSEA